MASDSGMRVGLVGLRFGAEFIPIYLHHPDVAELTICDADVRVLEEQGDRFAVDRRTTDLQQLLGDAELDAIHLVTPIPLHAEQAVAVLESGKHCACTVPMAITLEDLRAIVAAQRSSGRKYMMMETAVFTRGFLLARELLAAGELGGIQLLKGSHYQDMESWPPYWMGLPPFHYATHAVAPLLALAGRRAVQVHCYGSGTMRDELVAAYGNPYPCETAIFRLAESGGAGAGCALAGGALAAEVTRTLFHTARSYTESFCVYGDKGSFEWPQLEADDDPLLFRLGELAAGRGRPVTAERVTPPDRPDLLPPQIARFTTRGVYDEDNPHQSFLQGGGHHGSHPHLVHEFVRAIIEDREPYCGAVAAANWTAAGICAHQSALDDGRAVAVPAFD